jgi:hypothetical protein
MSIRTSITRALRFVAVLLTASFVSAQDRHSIADSHPRLLGSRAELRALAEGRPAEYQRMVGVARQSDASDLASVVSQALVAAIENDAELGRRARHQALKLVDGPIRAGHVTFGHDLALCALAYDLCFEWWTDAERERFHSYFNGTVDANVESETHVFHNGWYGYKNWGIGLAAYATYHENPRSPGRTVVWREGCHEQNGIRPARWAASRLTRVDGSSCGRWRMCRARFVLPRPGPST